MTIEIINKEEVKKFIENLKKSKLDGSKIGMKQAAFFVQNEVKESIAGHRSEHVSVDSGRFINSIDIKDGNDPFSQIVFTDISYAKFLEYGTSKLEPRSHFRNTAKRINNEVKKIIKENIV